MSIECLHNGVWAIAEDDHHRAWVRDQGLIHDPWMAGIVASHVRAGSIAVDAGANIGTLTYGMLKAGAIVYAFEPNYDAFQCMLRNCAEFADKLVAHPIGLSSKGGWARVVPFRNAGATRLVLDARGDVNVEALDDILPLDADVSLLKVDVEGMEPLVLMGAENTIARCKPAIICEVNSKTLEAAKFSVGQFYGVLDALGYRWQILQPDCRIDDEQYDVLATPK